VGGADEALRRLKEGNARYVAGRAAHPHRSAGRRLEVAGGQRPFAIVFGCADSRVPPEIVFDRGLGDLFVVRTAGQALDAAAVGSIELGVSELRIPLIMVLGHDQCGAVKATIHALETHAPADGCIGALVESIRPAVERVRARPGDLLRHAVRANVDITIGRLKASPILASALAEGKVRIVGGCYDLETGAVEITTA
jgi:carbonic anhydrase